MRQLKARLTKALAVLVVGGGLVATSTTSAQAAFDYINTTDLNCYSFQVIIGSNTTQNTRHFHHLSNGSIYLAEWNNGVVNTRRISAFVTSLSAAQVTTPGIRYSASRFCDH